jgi:hypothetical protein
MCCAAAHGTLTPDSAARPIATKACRARVGSGLASESRSFPPDLIREDVIPGFKLSAEEILRE